MRNFSYANEWNPGKSSGTVSVYFLGSHLWDVAVEVRPLALPGRGAGGTTMLPGLWLPGGLNDVMLELITFFISREML